MVGVGVAILVMVTNRLCLFRPSDPVVNGVVAAVPVHVPAQQVFTVSDRLVLLQSVCVCACPCVFERVIIAI